MTELSQDQLRQLCEALGWQGGTFWQVLEEVRRLRTASVVPHPGDALGRCFACMWTGRDTCPHVPKEVSQ